MSVKGFIFIQRWRLINVQYDPTNSSKIIVRFALMEQTIFSCFHEYTVYVDDELI